MQYYVIGKKDKKTRMKHSILLKVRNRPGVMAHVVGLFSRRSYNIESIAVGTLADPKESIITIIVDDQEDVQNIKRLDTQLKKLVDVISIRDFRYNESLSRELALILIEFEPSKLKEVIDMVQAFGAKIEDMSENNILIDISAASRKVHSLIRSLSRKYNIVEMARTGEVSLPLIQLPEKSLSSK